MRSAVRWSLVLLGIGPGVACGDDGGLGGETEGTGDGSTGAETITTTITSTATTTTTTTSGVDTGTGLDETGTTEGTGSVCGDAVVEGAESCDGENLNGQTCETQGLGAGTLTCTDACTLDVSGCAAGCGDGVSVGKEECDGDDLEGQTCVDLGFDGGELACTNACTLDPTACFDALVPVATDLVISEIMPNPIAVADPDGEWFELHNPSPTITYQLQDCAIEGGDVGETFTIARSLTIAPGGYLTFARDSVGGPGFAADFTWVEGLELDNVADTVRLVCDGVTVDEVAYDATFPADAGAAMNLEPLAHDASLNDVGTSWCSATAEYYDGDLGTPGAANTSCIVGTAWTIDFCRLQFPTVIEQLETTSITVYGRLYVAGLTDQSVTNDVDANVASFVGYGPDGSDPATSPDWTWTAAVPNAAWDGSAVGVADEDEYQAVMTIPAAGTYDFAYRFTGNAGFSFTYCDGDGPGSTNGYNPADAGAMTSTAAAPASALYISEYVEGSGNNKAIEIYNSSATLPANLTGCALRYYFNGNPTVGTTIPLAGIVDAESTYVVCDDDVTPLPVAQCDQLATPAFFNGDDAIELVCGETTLDVLGQIGVDPGEGWTDAGATVSTFDSTLRRDCTVTTGDPDGSDAFDPSVQWTSAGLDTFEDLGQHVCIAG